VTLDDRDRRILAALAENAWLTYLELGERVNLSASAAQRRVEKLIAAGAISGARAVVSPEALERPVRLYVLVELHDEAKSTLSRFAKRIAAVPDLAEAHYVAGAADIVLVMQTESMARFAAFAEEHLNANPSVRRYQTLTSLRALC
jgi:Lrp/AsnC family leucine-responsive transcriptional regulator